MVERGLAISYPGLRTKVARNWKLTERLYSRDGTSGSATVARLTRMRLLPTVGIVGLPKRSASGCSGDDRKGAEPPRLDYGTVRTASPN
jgi:hypothetical protein